MARGNTLFLMNGDPNAWAIVRAGEDSDLYVARFDDVPDEIVDDLADGGRPSQHWRDLILLDYEVLDVPDDDDEEPEDEAPIITCGGMNPPSNSELAAQPEDEQVR